MLNSVFIFAAAALSIWLWTKGEITLGAIAASNALILRLNQMSGWVLRSITSLFENTGTIENGMELIARPNALVDPPGAAPLIVTEGAIGFEDVTFRYGEGRPRDPRPVALHPSGREGRPGRAVGRRQVDARQPPHALLHARAGPHPDRRPGHRRGDAGFAARGDRHGDAGHLAPASLGQREHPLRAPRRRRGGDARGGRRRARRTLHRQPRRSARAHRLRRACRRARRQALRRPAPAHRDRPRHPEGRADPGARRGDGGARIRRSRRRSRRASRC